MWRPTINNFKGNSLTCETTDVKTLEEFNELKIYWRPFSYRIWTRWVIEMISNRWKHSLPKQFKLSDIDECFRQTNTT